MWGGRGGYGGGGYGAGGLGGGYGYGHNGAGQGGKDNRYGGGAVGLCDTVPSVHGEPVGLDKAVASSVVDGESCHFSPPGAPAAVTSAASSTTRRGSVPSSTGAREVASEGSDTRDVIIEASADAITKVHDVKAATWAENKINQLESVVIKSEEDLDVITMFDEEEGIDMKVKSTLQDHYDFWFESGASAS